MEIELTIYLDVEYVVHPARSLTPTDPGEPEEIELLSIIHNGEHFSPPPSILTLIYDAINDMEDL